MFFFRINLFLFFIFPTFLFAEFNIKFNNIIEHKINNEKLIYRITAKTKEVNNQNLKKDFIFVRKEEIISNNIFYTNGIFEAKNIKIEFKKGYFLEGDFVMIDTAGFYKENEFQSKKTIFKFNSLDFEDVFIKLNDKQYKKLKYKINL